MTEVDKPTKLVELDAEISRIMEETSPYDRSVLGEAEDKEKRIKEHAEVFYPNLINIQSPAFGKVRHVDGDTITIDVNRDDDSFAIVKTKRDPVKGTTEITMKTADEAIMRSIQPLNFDGLDMSYSPWQGMAMAMQIPVPHLVLNPDLKYRMREDKMPDELWCCSFPPKFNVVEYGTKCNRCSKDIHIIVRATKSSNYKLDLLAGKKCPLCGGSSYHFQMIREYLDGKEGKQK